MKNALLLTTLVFTLAGLTSCGDRSSLYDNTGPTLNSQGLGGVSIASALNEAPFVCDRYSKDGCIDEVLLMGKLNRGRLQTCASFFVGDNLVATAKKCLPRQERDQSFGDWMASACKQIAFKDLKGYVYTCDSIENQRYSEIILVNTKQKSNVGFLETTFDGVKFGDKNKIFEITSFSRGGTTNYALSEGKYTRAKKECKGITNSLLTTINGTKDSKNFVLSNCAIDWNSTGAPVIVDGKVAGMLHGKIEGDADFGAKVSERDGVALAENFACQTKFNPSTPADCNLHHDTHKRNALTNLIQEALVNNGSTFESSSKDITIFRKDGDLLVLETQKPALCSSVGDTGSFQACKVKLPMKNKFLSIIDIENVALDCETPVAISWKAVNYNDELTRALSFDDLSLNGYHTDLNFKKLNSCL